MKRTLSLEERENFVDIWTYWFMTPFLTHAYQKGRLNDDDLFDLSSNDKTSINFKIFSSYMKNGVKGEYTRWKFISTYVKNYYSEIFIIGFLFAMVTIVQFGMPLVLYELIQTLTKPNEPIYKGIIFSVLLLVLPILKSLFNHRCFLNANRLKMRIKQGLSVMVFKKMLNLSSRSKQKTQTGEIVNLMSVDTEKLADTLVWLNYLWYAPVMFIGVFAFMYRLAEYATFAGIGTLVILYPLNILSSRLYAKTETELLKVKDERIKIINEMLLGIRVVKFFAWEEKFKKIIQDLRSKEERLLKWIAVFESLQNSWTKFCVVSANMVVIVVALLLNDNLGISSAFTIISYFSILEHPLTNTTYYYSNVINAYVSLGRIVHFFNLEEIQTHNLLDYKIDKKERIPLLSDFGNHAIEIKDGEFKWDNTTILNEINFKIPKGSLVSIIGDVGAGKSTLLYSIFGDTIKTKGLISVNGEIGFVPQQPWIINATLRDNILFGNQFDEKRYHEILKVCQLEADLELLPKKDLSEIGENGVTLSGGQKARVSLARAIYFNPDIFLLDSPLSALDVHVGKEIFTKGFLEYMKGKTILLVTHSLQFLSKSDLILVMNQGRIKEFGTYQELMDLKGEFCSLISKNISHENEVEEKHEEKKEIQKSKQEVSGEKERLVVEEEREQGALSWSIFYNYFKGYGFFFFFACLFTGIFSRVTEIAANLWLGNYSSSENHDFSLQTFLIVYCSLGVGSMVSQLAMSIFFFFGNLRSSIQMHQQMLKSILASPMEFFDRNPIGRILNRFSKDQYTVDADLGYIMYFTFNILTNSIGTLIMICVATPPSIGIIIPVGIIYFLLQRYYRVCYREVKRLDSVSRSPIYSHFSSCIIGSSVIRAFNLKEEFQKENEKRLDDNYRASWIIILINRWISFHLETLSSVIVFFSAIFTLIFKNYFNFALLALSITYSLKICESLNWLIRYFVEVEGGLVSTERLLQYSRLKSEKPYLIKETEPKKTWPEKGKIEFKNVVMKYRENLGPVLRGISFNIKGGEKIGIVGRTGSGKSSLLLTIFRMVELTSGQILIDDIDISKIGLFNLRSKVSIIPQDPILFSGTFRSNIDPFNLYSDQVIWDSLKSVSMDKKIESMNLKLLEPITENGSNLSSGERQLLCLCRSLLNNNKIIIFDEATSNIDVETNKIIQKTIHETLKSQTVITVAHRLDTIIESDRIFVMKEGQIIENGSPYELLKNDESFFTKLVKDTGSNFASYLYELAEKSYLSK